MAGIKTLGQFIIEKQADFPYAKGELSRLLRDIGIASKIVNREVNKAGLVDILGDVGCTNVQGEDQKKLDVFANTQFIAALTSGGECCIVASEEEDEFVAIESPVSKNAKYIVCIDPLDGSSNIDCNVAVGTIFSIFRRKSTEGKATLEDVLQRGTEQVAAGYVIYGSSTMLVYTTGKGVNGFTLDPSIGGFNKRNYVHFPEGVKKYIKYAQVEDRASNRPYTSRYIGSMVADVHRNLIKGGIYMYPTTAGSPQGKLRLMYECNPMAFILEQAGGVASDGFRRIMEIEPTELHQRSAVYIGSRKMVEMVERLLAEQQAKVA